MNYTFDVGNHLTGLGYTFLFLKYILPIILVAVVIWFAYLGIRKLITGTDMTEVNKNQLLLALAVAGILFVVLLH